MIGRQVLETREAFTLQSLYEFMNKYWDKEKYGNFTMGRPTPASIEEYILLPATQRFLVIVYARKAGGLFSKKDKVILSVADAPGGIAESLLTSVPTSNILFGATKIGVIKNREDERKGPAEEMLQKYTAVMKQLLSEHSLLA